MNKKINIIILCLILIIFIIILSFTYWLTLTEKAQHKPQLYLLLRLRSPIIDVERINDGNYLLLSAKTFLEHHGNKFVVRFGEGKIYLVKVDPSRKTAMVFWNYSLSGYNIFTYPHVTNSSILIGIISGTVRDNTTIIKISLSNHQVEKLLDVDFYVLRINKFGELIALTGYDSLKNMGKVVFTRNSAKIFEYEFGNKMLNSLALDFSGHKYILVSGESQGGGFVTIFTVTSSGFREVRRVNLPSIAWDIKLARFGKEKTIILLGPKEIWSLNPSEGKVKTIFKVQKKGYYLSPMEIEDVDRDGFDEIFGVYHNDTQSYFIELKYSNGYLHPVLEYPVNLEGSFAIKYLKDKYFILASPEGGLYLLILG